MPAVREIKSAVAVAAPAVVVAAVAAAAAASLAAPPTKRRQCALLAHTPVSSTAQAAKQLAQRLGNRERAGVEFMAGAELRVQQQRREANVMAFMCYASARLELALPTRTAEWRELTVAALRTSPASRTLAAAAAAAALASSKSLSLSLSFVRSLSFYNSLIIFPTVRLPKFVP